MDWKDYSGKSIYLEVETSTGSRNYTGTVKEVTYAGKGINGQDIFFIEIIDKFSKVVVISTNSIKFIQEEKR